MSADEWKRLHGSEPYCCRPNDAAAKPNPIPKVKHAKIWTHRRRRRRRGGANCRLLYARRGRYRVGGHAAGRQPFGGQAVAQSLEAWNRRRFRIAEQDLAAYIGRGCPDLAPPPIDAGGRLCRRPARQTSPRWLDKLRDAAADQIRGDEDAARLFRDAPGGTTTIDIELRVTAKIQQWIDSPPDWMDSGFGTPAQRAANPSPVDRSPVLAHFVNGLRLAAGRIAAQDLNKTAAEQIYSAPEVYDAIVRQAREDFFAGRPGS